MIEPMRIDESSSSTASHLAESRTMTNLHDEYHRSSSLSSQKRSGVRNSPAGFDSAKKMPPRQRFSEKCLDADRKREEVLLKKRYIGKILDQNSTANNSPHIFTTTEVSFRWQLGLLIGNTVNFAEIFADVR